jgi:hypothetical protein
MRHPVAEYADPERGERIVVTSEAAYDSAAQINHVKYHYQNEASRSEVVLSFDMRQFFPQELDMLLAHAGFLIEEKYGERDESCFTADSPRQLVICRAAEGGSHPRKIAR